MMSEDRVQYGGNRALVAGDAVSMPSTFEGMLSQADVAIKSGFMPVEVKTPAQVVVIGMTGRDFGWSMMQSVRSIFVVKGKPTLSAQAMGALIWQRGHSYSIDEASNKRCVITFQRKGHKPYTHVFTIEDAQAANLTGSQTWKSYTKAMLFNRCMSAGARAYMPDVIMGMYTPEEIAGPDNVVLDDDGEVVKVIDGEFKVTEQVSTESKAEPKPESQAKPPFSEPSGVSTRQERLMKHEEWRTALAEFDPEGHGRAWAKGHVKKHFSVDSPTSLSDEQLDASNADFEDIYREITGAAEMAAA